MKTNHSLIQCNSFVQPGKGVAIDRSNKTPAQSHPFLLLILWQHFWHPSCKLSWNAKTFVKILCMVSLEKPWTAAIILMFTGQFSALPRRFRRSNSSSSLWFLCPCLCCQKRLLPPSQSSKEHKFEFFSNKSHYTPHLVFFFKFSLAFSVTGSRVTKFRMSLILHSWVGYWKSPFFAAIHRPLGKR